MRFLLLLAAVLVSGSPHAWAADFTPRQLEYFESDVKPILAAHCLKCHGAEAKVKGGFQLNSRAAILAGGDTGPAFDPKDASSSLLLKAVTYKDEMLKMPPKGKLPDKDIAILTKWIADGLAMPADRQAGAPEPQPQAKGGVVTAEAKHYWAYQPIRKPSIPAVKAKGWPRSPVDAFVLAQLEARGLRPAAPADRGALVRRAYYDLLGLPPTPEQVDAFVKDSAPDAWETLIDALLASPHYGEKWGRHWLDVVRYAETNGYERDSAKPFAWKYRDYVIRSFNDDKPYDRFVKEQIAGDELPDRDADTIAATGFYRLGTWDDEPADREQALFEGYDDLVTVTGQGFLGMTLNCARCHDHKVDPIPQTDYYRLLAFFREIRPHSYDQGARSPSFTDVTPPERRTTTENERRARQDRLDELTGRMTSIEDAAIKKLSAEDQRASEGPQRAKVVARVLGMLSPERKAQYRQLKKERTALERQRPASLELALSVNNCDVRPLPVHVLARGNPHAPGKEVAPGFPEVLGMPDPVVPAPKPGAKTSGRRTALANWLISKDNPLTARVLVNRVWQNHFGRGLVPTANDFGKLGEQPTHPELLDFLAADFVEGGWHIKRLHKQLMLSNTYQLSARANAAGLKADPGNAWLGRFNMRRLAAEEVRDSMLAVSGDLDPKLYGPSVYPRIPPDVLAGQSIPGKGWPASPAAVANRRSVYVHVKRALQVPILAIHDQADTDSSCPVRYTTTVPTQALGLLNGEFANERAAAFAARLRKEAPSDVRAQVARGIRLTTGRVAQADEIARDAAFIASMKIDFHLDDATALARYALLLLNANEFVYLD